MIRKHKLVEKVILTVLISIDLKLLINYQHFRLVAN